MLDKSRLTILFLALMLALGGASLAGCDNQGPAEETGEEIDDAMDDAGDAMDDAGDEMEDTFDN
ncbi:MULTISPECIES: hypothetical protein [Thioalkalivibrio]|uniref:hypothetical protein n=1 Tax=Thioalkalivibrio TaxID=106633 RepID=UPI0003606E79|nr:MULTISPECIES: hypothetical protein [Thioalkalivibrio]